MDDFKKLFNEIFEIENIDEIKFKKMKIDENRIIYFAFHENQKIVQKKVTSGSIEPKAFILKINGEYHYCPLKNEKFDEKIIEKFAHFFSLND